jgi:hypothetical protein|tara:strand:+ start:79 stop:477 length:399 start_codon:yes stop_codon:yes gene_type:complete
MTKYILITTDGGVKLDYQGDGLANKQKAVGGLIEYVGLQYKRHTPRNSEKILLRDNIKISDRVPDADGVAWVNENGLSMNLARNWRATEIISNMFEGASFVGDVLFEIYNEDMYDFLKTISRRSRWKNYLVR